jgi:hypothetical protein
MYASENFKSKKALKEAIASGRIILITSPGPFPAPSNGRAAVEGPYFPEPHRWYADCDIKDGRIVKVR